MEMKKKKRSTYW